MNPIVYSLLGFAAVIVGGIGISEFIRRKGGMKVRIRYAHFFALTLVLIAFAALSFLVLQRVFPNAQLESKIAVSAAICWLPVGTIAYMTRKRTREKRPNQPPQKAPVSAPR